MSQLAFTRRGRGAPIVLLHALGSSRHSFDPIIPALATHFDVIAIDLPGFGDSKPLPASVEPKPCRSGWGRRRAAGPTRRPVTTPGRKLSRRLGGARTGCQVPARLGHPARTGRTLGADTRRYTTEPVSQATRWLSRHALRFLCRLVDFRLGRARGSRPDPRPPYAHDPTASAIRDPLDGYLPRLRCDTESHLEPSTPG